MSEQRAFLLIAVISLVTAGIRFLPFLLFTGKRKTPKVIEKLGQTLPYAVMGMLVVYCLKDVSLFRLESFLPALAGTFVVWLLYVWQRNTLFSIISGTLCYMFFVQIVF